MTEDTGETGIGFEDEKDLVIDVAPDATFADLFAKQEEMEGDNVGAMHLEGELWDNFAPEIAALVIDMRGKTEAATTGVLDFFEQHGIDRDDVEDYLPIQFTKNEGQIE